MPFCKKSPQNPTGKRVKGQNLENARVKPLHAALIVYSLSRDHDLLIFLWNARADVTRGLRINARRGKSIPTVSGEDHRFRSLSLIGIFPQLTAK
jgi:hypothetical protein